VNPVLIREMKTTFRTWKTICAIAVYVFIFTLVTGLALWAIVSNSYNGFNPASAVELYWLMCGYQLVIIYIIVPAFTSGSISGERERQTLDLMLVTKMSTFEIIIGKLMSSLLVTIIMIISSIPVYATIFCYGGINFGGFAVNIIFSIINAIFVGSVSIFYSTLFKKSIIANIVTYLTLFVITVGSLIILWIVYLILGSNYKLFFPLPFSFAVLSINPIIGFLSIVDYQLGSSNAIAAIFSLTNQSFNRSDYFPVWIITVIFIAVLSIIFIKISSVILNPIKKTKNKVTKI